MHEEWELLKLNPIWFSLLDLLSLFFWHELMLSVRWSHCELWIWKCDDVHHHGNNNNNPKIERKYPNPGKQQLNGLECLVLFRHCVCCRLCCYWKCDRLLFKVVLKALSHSILHFCVFDIICVIWSGFRFFNLIGTTESQSISIVIIILCWHKLQTARSIY